MPPVADVYEASTVLGVPAVVLAFGILALGVGAVLGLLAQARAEGALARAAAADEREAGTLAPGRAALRGRVVADGAAPIVLSITERGREWDDEGKQHEWIEVRRELETQPFHLLLPSGERVRVEPGSDPHVVTALVPHARPSRTERVRRARVLDGETAYVSGVLAEENAPPDGTSYRETRRRWVLRRAARPMLVATEPLSAVHRDRARAAAVAAGILGAVVALHQLLAVRPYYEQLFAGTPEVGEVTRLETHVTHGDDGDTTHYDIRFRVDGTTRERRATIAESDWRRLGPGDRIALLVGPGHAVQLGSTASLATVPVGAGVVVVSVVGALLYVWIRRLRKWWERRPLVTRGVGPLPD